MIAKDSGCIRHRILRDHGRPSRAPSSPSLDIRSALAALPPRQRATLVLRYYCDLDVIRTAHALGCSTGTVKSQTAKGLTSLRQALEPAGPGTDVFAADVCSIRVRPAAGASGAESMGLSGAPSADGSSAPSAQGFTCGQQQPLTAASPAPPVNGRPAYWIFGDALVWEYAPRAWAWLAPDLTHGGFTGSQASARKQFKAQEAAMAGWMKMPASSGQKATAPSAGTLALLLKVATRVRYGQTTPIIFPFQLTGVPAGWDTEGNVFQVSGKRLLGDTAWLSGRATTRGRLPSA